MGAGKNHTENNLLAGFRQGHEDCFGKVFNQLYPLLCFYALRYTKDQLAAEDIAGESFMIVWNRREVFFQFNVLKSYLYTTVRNAAINWNKQQRRRWTYEQEMASGPPQYEKHVLDDLIRAELLREVYDAIDILPSECHKIVRMVYVDGKTTREIANELDLSVSTVKSQKNRGLILLRKRLPRFLILAPMILRFFAGDR
jgi:RNA polymerase sigma-70 factor (family 1)